MKKVIIIGAGISGLSAGIFGQMCGFETEVYEMHSIAGGECTGWSRKGYHFDNCIHWLTGTKEDTDLYNVWKAVGALGNVEIYNSEYLYSYNDGKETFYMYKDINKLEKHMLEISPQDSKEIYKFIDIVKGAKNLSIPTKKPMDMMNAFDYIKLMMQYKSIGKYAGELNELYLSEYVANFKSELIKEALLNSLPKGYSSMALFVTMGIFSTGNGGWPKGGSLAMSLRMEDRYKELGGKVRYKAKVKRIIIEDNIAKGIELENGEIIYGDHVISAIDANILMKNLLGNKFKDKILDNQFNDREKYTIHSSVDLGLGVKCDLSNRDHSAAFKVEPFKCGDVFIDEIGIHHYCHEKEFSPKRCSTMRIHILGDFYDYWNKLKESNSERYYKEKDRIANDVMERISKIYPETEGLFEVYDVSTPVTYERYCGAYKGAWMGFALSPKADKERHNGYIKDIKNLFVAGQWLMLPGGLPSACLTGKWAIQRLCKEEKIKFNFK